MRIKVVVEWKGGDVGWIGSAVVPRRGEIQVKRGHSPTVVRKRIRRALKNLGIEGAELVEDVRIPVKYREALRALQEERLRLQRVTEEFHERRMALATRMLTDLNMPESEVAGLMGISPTYLGNLLRAADVDTAEFQVTTGARRKPVIPSSKTTANGRGKK